MERGGQGQVQALGLFHGVNRRGSVWGYPYGPLVTERYALSELMMITVSLGFKELAKKIIKPIQSIIAFTRN